MDLASAIVARHGHPPSDPDPDREPARPYAVPPPLDCGPGVPPRVPPEYHRRLDELAGDPASRAAVAAARAWRESDRLGLLLVGPVGTGKSCLAGALAVEAGAPGWAHWWSTTAYLSALKAEMRSGPERPVADKIAARDLLVLDDLGAEKPSDWSASELASLISDRWEQHRRLVVTTNLTSEQRAARYGERVESRLQAMCTVVAVTGPDRRRG